MTLPSNEEFLKKMILTTYKEIKEIEEKDEGLQDTDKKILSMIEPFQGLQLKIKRQFEKIYHTSSLSLFDPDKLLDEYGTRGLNQRMKLGLREMMDALDIKYDLEKPNQNDGKSIHITQNPIITQNTNQTQNLENIQIQTISNFIDLEKSISNLKLNQESEKQIFELIRKFEEERKKSTPDESKLKKYLKMIAPISIEAASLVLKYAHSIGILGLLLL